MTLPDQNELRKNVQSIIAAFGLAAAFHGINKKNPIPPDPTDEIMEKVQAEILAARIDELKWSATVDLKDVEWRIAHLEESK